MFTVTESDQGTVYAAEFSLSEYGNEDVYRVNYTVADGYLLRAEVRDAYRHEMGDEWTSEYTFVVETTDESAVIPQPEIVEQFDAKLHSEDWNPLVFRVNYVLLQQGIISEYAFRQVSETEFLLTCVGLGCIDDRYPDGLYGYAYIDALDGFPLEAIALDTDPDYPRLEAKNLVIPATVWRGGWMSCSHVTPTLFIGSARELWDANVIREFLEDDAEAVYFAGEWEMINGSPVPLG